MSWKCPIFAILAFSCFCLSAAAQVSASTALAECTPAPISAVIRNISIANSPHGAVARGIAISVGTPAQEFAMMPYPWNNSLLYDSTNLCYADSDDSEAQCITRRGGAYSPSTSETQKIEISDATATDPSPYPSTSLYSDVWNLNDETILRNFTFGVPLNDWGEQFYYPQAVIGLGPNSTFLNSLKDQNMIASRSWSYFWGRDGTGSQSNGSIVFGGYDRAKIAGATTSNYTGKLNYTLDCMWGTTVEVSALSLFSYKGTTVNLNSGDQERTLYGCIDFGAPGLFNMPLNDEFNNFLNNTDYESWYEFQGSSSMRSFGLNFYDMLYLPNDTAYRGDIDITIKDGPSITVTNDQLVVPNIYMDDEGIWQANSSQYDLLINEVNSADNLKMGRHMLSFLYVMVNLDAEEFTVWAAATQSNSEVLVAVDGNDKVLADATICDAATSTAASVNVSSSTGSSKISGGAIAGIVIGAVALVGFMLAGVWFLFRRRKEQQDGAAKSTEEPPSYYSNPNNATPYGEAVMKDKQPQTRNGALEPGGKEAEFPSELGSTEARHRSELIGDTEVRYELA